MEFMEPPLFTRIDAWNGLHNPTFRRNGFGASSVFFFYMCCFLVNDANVISVRKIIVENCLVKSFEKHESNYVQPQRYMRGWKSLSSIERLDVKFSRHMVYIPMAFGVITHMVEKKGKCSQSKKKNNTQTHTFSAKNENYGGNWLNEIGCRTATGFRQITSDCERKAKANPHIIHMNHVSAFIRIQTAVWTAWWNPFGQIINITFIVLYLDSFIKGMS